MLSVRFAAILLLVSSALATPLNLKRNAGLVNLYSRTDNSSQANSTVASSNNNQTSSSSNSSSSNQPPSPPPNSPPSPPPSPPPQSQPPSSGQGSSSSSSSSYSLPSNIDGFNGHGNFDGSHNTQIIIHEKEVVCHTQQIEIIQQKLVVLQELMKRIVTEQVCEVETQTIVLEQFQSGIQSFGHDISRQSSKQVGYDSHVAGLVSGLTNSDGSLSTNDLGFNGSSVGSQTIIPSGSNWDNSTGPAAVANAKAAAKAAKNATKSS